MKEKFKIKIVAIAKDESAYIPQWVFHHLHFGFDAVEVWVNNTTDNSVKMLGAIGEKVGRDVVSVIEADDVLAQCIANNGLFQPEVYNRAYRREVERGEYSHLMFLDMDELWTPLNFKDSIKDVLARYPDSDGISFLWMVDYPDAAREVFSRPFLMNNRLQKDRHVKSLVKVSPRTRSVRIHNHVSSGQVFHLGDGTEFENDEDVLSVNWAYISDNQLKERLKIEESYFVVHQIYRSQEEYLSSLLRGRQHARDENLFKVNRWGYVPFHVDAYTQEIKIDGDFLSEYNARYVDFLRENKLASLLESAHDFIMGRYETALSMLRSDASLFGRYRNQLRGLRVVDEIYEKNSVAAEIELITQATPLSPMELIGWASDVFKNRALKYQCELADGSVVNLLSQRIARPDIRKTHPERGPYCGFRIEIPPEVVGEVFDVDSDMLKLIVKTLDEKETLVCKISAADIARVIRNPESKNDQRCSIGTASMENDVLSVNGRLFGRVDSRIEMYAEINEVLFAFQVEKGDSITVSGEPAVEFSAKLSFIDVPKEWKSKVPNYVLVLDGERKELEFDSSYLYPMDRIYELLERSIPTASVKSSMPKQEQLCLVSIFKDSRAYLSYGAPDTPMMAFDAGVRDVVFSDSDAEILDVLNYSVALKWAGSSRRFHSVLTKIGKTKEFGYPVDNSEWSRYPLYALMPWNCCAEKGISPDVVLIDARFRVSCFLVSLIMAIPGTVVLFDDYVDRPQYHVVETLVKPVDIYGRLAKFIVPENLNFRVLTRLLLQNCNNAL
ncbi:glycosyl transferase 2 family protein [Burkholderia cenocepacia]|uniref:Glycosyl transferase 2 family protein n=1 Tax=Burkholderia cenocepacia TaxID=95486 RepID=A0AAN0RQT5_9BURK|nr:glycosyl transferase 2 family protein [Burkholderia cenocepacia]